MDKEYYKAIDFTKLFMSVCVVAIHTDAFLYVIPDLNYWYLEKMIFRIGVPFFFIASGFFFGEKYYSDKYNLDELVRKYIKSLMKPLIFFQIINLILRSINQFLGGASYSNIILQSVRSIIFYPYGALWYIHASIVAILLLYYFIKNKKMSLALIIGFFFYLIGLLGNSYYFLIENTMLANLVDVYRKIAVSSRNGVFVGFLLLGIGIWLSQKVKEYNKQKLKKISMSTLAVTFVLFFIEVTLVYGNNVIDSGDYYIMLPGFVSSLFVFLYTTDINVSESTSKVSRKLSTGIYYLHCPIIYILNIIQLILGGSISNVLLFNLVMLICLMTLYFVYKKKSSPLHKLLS